MDSSFSPKDKIWVLRVCHHISNAVYDKNFLKTISIQSKACYINIATRSFRIIFLYFFDETLFLLFCSRQITYLNNSGTAEGRIIRFISYFPLTTKSTYDSGAQNGSCSQFGEAPPVIITITYKSDVS